MMGPKIRAPEYALHNYNNSHDVDEDLLNLWIKATTLNSYCIYSSP